MKPARLLPLLFTLAFVAMLASCTTIPEQLQGEYAEVSPARVHAETFGTDVRWGGVIIGTRTEQDRSCFEILSRDLGKYMRPKIEDRTAGRFIACTPGFYDPEVYSKGREVTVVGTIEDVEMRKVDEFDYRYPTLAVNSLVLWEKREDVLVYSGFHYPYHSPYYWGGLYPYRYPYWGYPYHGYHGGGGTVRMRKTLPGPSETTVRVPVRPDR